MVVTMMMTVMMMTAAYVNQSSPDCRGHVNLVEVQILIQEVQGGPQGSVFLTSRWGCPCCWTAQHTEKGGLHPGAGLFPSSLTPLSRGAACTCCSRGPGLAVGSHTGTGLACSWVPPLASGREPTLSATPCQNLQKRLQSVLLRFRYFSSMSNISFG